jgi:hypothetical protein
MGPDGDDGIDGITTTVVSMAAALNPHNESEQPIMQLIDTDNRDRRRSRHLLGSPQDGAASPRHRGLFLREVTSL